MWIDGSPMGQPAAKSSRLKEPTGTIHFGQTLSLSSHSHPSARTSEQRGFYNFTIITNGTHQIITFRMTPTTIPSERSLSFSFTTFADVARHASCTRWHPVSRLKCNVLPAPDLLLSPLSPTAGSRSSSHFHVGLTHQLCLLQEFSKKPAEI